MFENVKTGDEIKECIVMDILPTSELHTVAECIPGKAAVGLSRSKP